LEEFVLHLFKPNAASLSLAPHHTADPLPFHDTRKDRVDPDPERPQLHGDGLGETDRCPFGRGVWGAQGKAETPCRGREIDDGSVVALLQMPGGLAGVVKLTRVVDRKRPVPILGLDLNHSGGRARDARIVDENIEPAIRFG
jgi:hypothetical protein